jgi:hypothetical protein
MKTRAGLALDRFCSSAQRCGKWHCKLRYLGASLEAAAKLLSPIALTYSVIADNAPSDRTHLSALPQRSRLAKTAASVAKKGRIS